MNTQIFQGHWKEFKGMVKEKFGKLTDDDITEINGKRDQMLGKLQQRYGYEKERAEAELTAFEELLDFDDLEDER